MTPTAETAAGPAEPLVEVTGVAKTFTLHIQGGTEIRVFDRIDLAVRAGECVALDGPSGAGKSTLLRAIYGNYRIDRGAILIRHGAETIDIARAEPRQVLELRRRTMAQVSQFLRVVPRVPAIEVVADPLIRLGRTRDDALAEAHRLLTRLRIPERLWPLAPATFSGGEQQRVNIARGLVGGLPILLLDEPTAALDAVNRATVVDLIRETKHAGTAVIGIFHDRDVRDSVADRVYRIPPEG